MKKVSPAILLVNPWIHDFAAFDAWSKPLGLLYIASVLRAEGFSARIIDCLDWRHPSPRPGPKRLDNGSGHFRKTEIPKPASIAHIPRKYSRYGMDPLDFRRDLLSHEKPDAVFITSMMTYWYPGVFEAIGIVKKCLPGVPVVLGGIYATLCPDHALKFSGADLVVTGDVLPAAPGRVHLSSAAGGRMRTPSNLQGILEEVVGCALDMHSRYDSLDALPYPAYDLLPAPDVVALVTSRGCPYSCTYCASPYLHESFETRDPHAVVDEIAFWNGQMGIRNFSFYDDALLVDSKNRAVPMLEEIIRRKLDCSFHCPNGLHIREINRQTASLLYRAGFKTLRFGLETAGAREQIEFDVKVSDEEAEQAVRYLIEAGYRGEDIGMYLLCGLPGQEVSNVMAGIAFVASLGAYPIITEYSPIPGTFLWHDAVAVSSLDLEKEPLFHNNTILPCGGATMSTTARQDVKTAARACRKTLIQGGETISMHA
ncbi:MAG: radical SAM protein [Syntrophales bacterium]|jgi:radical SAM superfamily enzyme YgiQ (UPF0313 family)|nr:radical SAM protein [Syntrophales bacterium]MCK9528222.1 radical SAM protein [Syntrophales bacterium]MDX9921370.1 radical SAM protein [Syntrophales bacterium]